MAIEEVVDWSVEARDNQAVHPTSREGERAVRISRSIQEIQAAIARWRDSLGGSGSVAWGDITGTLSDQTDLQTALDAKANLSGATFTGGSTMTTSVNEAVLNITQNQANSGLLITKDNAGSGDGLRVIMDNPSGTGRGAFIETQAANSEAAVFTSVGGNRFVPVVEISNPGGTGAGVALQVSSAAGAAIDVTDGEINHPTMRTISAATGGLEANNTLTGAGFERVLTTSDGAGIPASGTVTNSVLRWSGTAWVEQTQFEVDVNGGIARFGTQDDARIDNNTADTITLTFPPPATSGTLRLAVGASDGHSIVSGNALQILDAANGDDIFLYNKNAGVTLYYNDVAMMRTAAITSGGLEVNNTVTGAGFERVLTTSDLGGGIGGSIADNQVAVGAATAGDIEGSASLTWDGSDLFVGTNARLKLHGGNYVVGAVTFQLAAVTQDNWVTVGELQSGSYTVRIGTQGFALYNSASFDLQIPFDGAADADGSFAGNIGMLTESDGFGELEGIFLEWTSADSANLWLQLQGTASGTNTYTVSIEGVSEISTNPFVADGTVTQVDPTLTALTPGIRIVGDGTQGVANVFYSTSLDQVFSRGGTERFRVDSGGASVTGRLLATNDVQVGNSAQLIIPRSTGQRIIIDNNNQSGTSPAFFSYSDVGNAKNMIWNVTTDALDTAPTGGNLAHAFYVRGQQQFRLEEGFAQVINDLIVDNALTAGDTTLTANFQNDVNLFGDGSLAQAGAFYNKLKIFGGSGQSRDLQLYQVASGDATIGTSFSSNNLNISGFDKVNVTTNNFEVGPTTGGVGLTTNDGYGNANLTFNHLNGIPGINGSACRIETSVDSTTASMVFEMGNSVTSGVAVSLTNVATVNLADGWIFNRNLRPNSDGAWDLGTTTVRWGTLWVDSIELTNNLNLTDSEEIRWGADTTRILGNSNGDFINFYTNNQLTMALDTNRRVYCYGTDDVDLVGVSGSLIIGGDGTGAHIAIDGNEIMAKGSATTTATLNMQAQGGNTALGGDLSLSYINGYAGTQNDGDVLTWVNANNRFESKAPAGAGGITFGTPQTPTGVSTVTFTGIPSDAKRIIITFVDLSSTGAGQLRVRLGDAGGIETTGYKAGAPTGSTQPALVTGYFPIAQLATGAFNLAAGQLILTRLDDGNNTWVLAGEVLYDGSLDAYYSPVGRKTTSAALDRVEVYWSVGNYDAGTVNIAYET